MNFEDYVFVVAFRIKSNIVIAFVPKTIGIGYDGAGIKVIDVVRKSTFGLVLLDGATVFWLYYAIYGQ